MAAPSDDLPGGLRTARFVLWIQGLIGIFTGILFILGNASFATALGISGAGGTAVVVLAGLVITVASALVIWGATRLGALSRRARRWVLAYEYVSVLLGLITIPDDIWQGALRIVLAAVVIYYLQVDADARAAFGLPAELRRGSSS